MLAVNATNLPHSTQSYELFLSQQRSFLSGRVIGTHVDHQGLQLRIPGEHQLKTPSIPPKHRDTHPTNLYPECSDSSYFLLLSTHNVLGTVLDILHT